jgi:hypothetical protein
MFCFLLLFLGSYLLHLLVLLVGLLFSFCSSQTFLISACGDEETINLLGGWVPETEGVKQRQLDKPEPIGANLRGAL